MRLYYKYKEPQELHYSQFLYVNCHYRIVEPFSKISTFQIKENIFYMYDGKLVQDNFDVRV